MTVDKLPWTPLAQIAKVPIRYDANIVPSRLDYARFFEVSPQTIDRWKRNGVPWFYADRVAVKYVGVHPGTIWPEWFGEAA